MRTDIAMTFNNNYHIELIDSKTNEIKQSGNFHNIVTCGFFKLLCGTYSTSDNFPTTDRSDLDYSAYSNILYALSVGSGSREPNLTDTYLQSPLWTVDGSGNNVRWLDDYTVKLSSEFTFPATTSYVGEVREVGLLGRYYRTYQSYGRDATLLTRSLLTDSEGQPISFKKTDTDILKITVTVEFAINSSVDNFTLFKKPAVMNSIISNSDSCPRNRVGKLCMLENVYDLKQDDIPFIAAYHCSCVELSGAISVATKKDEGYFRYPTTRLGSTNITTETYYRAIVIGGIGYWELPNENIFPAYSITDISIGTGDGSTLSFDNPLCYFKKDTEKIYKNGVLLTRNEDYTIDNKGNRLGLPFINDEVPTRIYSNAGDVTYAVLIPFLPSSYLVTKGNETRNFARGFNAANPLYVEYEEPVTFNCIKCLGSMFACTASGYDDVPTNTTFYFDYSNDGIDYEELGSVTTTAIRGVFELDFIETTAKYWRLRTNCNRSGVLAIQSYDTSDRLGLYATRKNPYITFSEAPADGDLLTMDVEMDVIMKNSNYAVDVGCQINFKI